MAVSVSTYVQIALVCVFVSRYRTKDAQGLYSEFVGNSGTVFLYCGEIIMKIFHKAIIVSCLQSYDYCTTQPRECGEMCV